MHLNDIKATVPVASSPSPRLVVELGIGDGRLLKSLARNGLNQDVFYEGIEVDVAQCELAMESLPANAKVINSLCQDAIGNYADSSVDEFIAVLPDQSLIDRGRENEWTGIYRMMRSKLKQGGRFVLVTELTNDLFDPVPEIEFFRWLDWLIRTFESVGFKLISSMSGAPGDFSTRCLDQFRGDSSRIRIITLELIRPFE